MAAKLPLGQFEAGQPAGLLLLPLGLLDLLASLLHQRRASGGGLALGFTQQHPRLITGAGGVLVLAVGEARQAAIVAAVGAGRVGVVLAGQRPGNLPPEFTTCGVGHLDPCLIVLRAGLHDQRRLPALGFHVFQVKLAEVVHQHQTMPLLLGGPDIHVIALGIHPLEPWRVLEHFGG